MEMKSLKSLAYKKCPLDPTSDLIEFIFRFEIDGEECALKDVIPFSRLEKLFHDPFKQEDVLESFSGTHQLLTLIADAHEELAFLNREAEALASVVKFCEEDCGGLKRTIASEALARWKEYQKEERSMDQEEILNAAAVHARAYSEAAFIENKGLISKDGFRAGVSWAEKELECEITELKKREAELKKLLGIATTALEGCSKDPVMTKRIVRQALMLIDEAFPKQVVETKGIDREE